MKLVSALFLLIGLCTAQVSADTPPYGANGPYTYSYPDTTWTTANVTTATTVQVVTGAAGKYTYIFSAGWFNSNTNTALTLLWLTGTGTNCNTGTVYPFLPILNIPSTVAEFYTTYYGGSASAAAATGINPASVPYVLQPGVNLCVTTTGSTIAGYPIVIGTQH